MPVQSLIDKEKTVPKRGPSPWIKKTTRPASGFLHIINIPRQSRGYFLCGQSPMLLARASRRASTVCQPREFCYLLPVNGFRNFPSSVVLLLCPRPTDGECTPRSSSHFFPPYLHNTLGTKIPGSGTYTVVLGTSRRSLDYSFLLGIP